MFDILFQNAAILTVNEEDEILSGAFVGIKDGKIAYVGETSPEETAKDTIDAADTILMPGLINAHGHTAMTLFRGFADDLRLSDWLTDYIFPAEDTLSDEDIAVGTRLGYMESLAAGITSISDMYLHSPVIYREAAEAKIKTNICRSFERTRKQQGFADNDCITETRYNLSHPIETNGRVIIDIAIHAPYTSGPEEWKMVSEFAENKNLRIQTHLAETKTERDRCLLEYGESPIAVFADAGVFDVPTCAAHCVWVDEEDIGILREKNVTVAHNPLSNLKLASGIAPVKKMLDNGLNVALGSDGASSNNTLDLFEEAKAAALLQKGTTYDPTALSARQVLRMLTINGAKAQGREETTGSIEVGKDADLILISTEKPHIQPLYHPENQIIYCARGSDVTLTMVQGKILYRNGEFTTIDAEKTYAQVKAFARVHKK